MLPIRQEEATICCRRVEQRLNNMLLEYELEKFVRVALTCRLMVVSLMNIPNHHTAANCGFA
jgi:hypothetical protein